MLDVFCASKKRLPSNAGFTGVTSNRADRLCPWRRGLDPVWVSGGSLCLGEGLGSGRGAGLGVGCFLEDESKNGSRMGSVRKQDS